MFVAVPADRDPEPVRSFQTFTVDLERLADWLQQCRIETVAMESTGVYWALSCHAQSSQSFLGEYFRRLKSRMGTPKAMTAAAHKLARIVYHLITTKQEY